MDTFEQNLIRILVVSLRYFELPLKAAHAEPASVRNITRSAKK